MSDFTDDIDWMYAAKRLKLACMGQVLELQLVWMFEILSIVLFSINIKHKYVIRLDKSYRLTHANMKLLADTVGLQKRTVGYLSDYRDKFVHFGYLEAQPQLDKLLENVPSEDMDKLQRITGVTLDFNSRLL